jgi:DNA polymerase-1
MTHTSPLVLVDGSSYLYRAYFASQQADLRTSSGQPTGAIRVVTNMLLSLLKQFPGADIAVVFDAKGKSFRNDLYTEYKANRPPMPDDLRSQITPIHQIVQGLGLPLLVIDGVEADDVIGTLAQQATAAERHTVISTGDKDMAQLVSDYVTLMDTMKNQNLDRDGVQEKFGVPPERIIDFLALMGDTSDNIPGMAGVGEKTAVAVIQGVGGIDELMADPDRIATLSFRGAKTFAAKFLEQKEMVLLSRQLATIKTDVDLPVSIDSLQRQPIDHASLAAIYEQCEFKRLAEDLQRSDSGVPASTASADEPVPAAVTAHYETILTESEFFRWLEKLTQAELISFDTETTSLDYMVARIVGVSLAVAEGEAAYIPLAHDYPDAPVQLDRDWVLAQLKPILEDPQIRKVGQHLKYDRNVLMHHDIDLQGIAFDTMLESYVLNSTATRHNMDVLAQNYLHYTTQTFEDVAGKGAKQLTFNQVEIEKAAFYAAEDADITLRLHHYFWPKIEQEPVLRALLLDMEMPLQIVLSDMELTGTLIEPFRLQQQSQEIEIRLAELEKEAHDLAGQPFNLGSPKQLGEILFEKLQLPVIKKTPKGAPSTAEDVLQELAYDYPLPKLLLEYRSLSKLKSTYTDKLPLMIAQDTGRVHTSYHQAVTATGRLSSSDPNLQNIPVRTEEGRRIRQAFIAEEGYKLVSADYSQIELRIMAHLSEDAGLLNAFACGQDIHRATAAEIMGVAPDEVTPEQRRNAKAINFGLIYGMSAFGLAKQLGIPRGEAQRYMDRYFERYPGVLSYMERTRAQAEAQGYVETLFGRRLYLPDIKARNAGVRKAAERAAINAPMQGTAADIIKRAMIRMADWIKTCEPGTITMVLQVHDELVFEIREDRVDSYVPQIRAHMSDAAELKVPLDVGIGVGENWDEAH